MKTKLEKRGYTKKVKTFIPKDTTAGSAHFLKGKVRTFPHLTLTTQGNITLNAPISRITAYKYKHE